MIGRAFGVRVAADAFGHTFGVRVDGAAPRGLWPPTGGGLCIASLRGATAPAALRVVDCRSAVHSEHILKER